MIIYLIIIIIFLLLLCCISNNKIKIEINESFKTNSKALYTAVIVEPREHKALKFVLENFAENLSNEWNIIIFHGNKNEEFILDILNNSNILKDNIDRITLINLNVDNLTIKEYNNLLLSRDFYNNIPTEVFLIFQTDTIICKTNKDLINNYLEYDYVGAPWRKSKVVGNGGLSLRRKTKMLELIDKCEYRNQNEDLFFAYGCDDVYINKPSFESAKEFSVEQVYNDVSFGVHKPWGNLKGDYLDNKIDMCDGLENLINLNT
jgi:hypothetical protein